jgi:GTPase SAR1 family protein
LPLDGKFSEKFTPTIGVDFKMKVINVRDKTVKLQLWDTAGQEKFFTIAKSYYVSSLYRFQLNHKLLFFFSEMLMQ